MNTSKLKVCFVVGTLGRGGAEKQLLYMLMALNQAGIKTKVLCLTKGEDYEEEINKLGIPVEWVGKSSNRLARLLTIIRKVRKESPDVLQSSHFYTNIYVGLAGKILGIPNIGAIRNDLLSEIKSHNLLGKYQVSLPQILIANSKKATENSVKEGFSEGKIKFIPNVVYSNYNEIKQSSAAEINIIFVGRLVEQKRPERFIKLAAVLLKKFSKFNLRFKMIGDGVLREELEHLVEKLHLTSENFEFLGMQKDTYKIYENADILISTSDFEGTSNVILEAMSFQIPVIATNVGGTPEILDQSRGILLEPGNEEQLELATTKLILNKELRQELGKAGRIYIENNHSINNLQNQLKNIYTKLIF